MGQQVTIIDGRSNANESGGLAALANDILPTLVPQFGTTEPARSAPMPIHQQTGATAPDLAAARTGTNAALTTRICRS